MKRILAFTLAIVTLIASLSLLSSCGKDDDGIPEGLQLVRGGEDVGYYFYGPDGWTVANQGDISATYVSNINYTSLTFVPLKTPDSTDENFSFALYIKGLFDADMDKYSRSPFSEFTLIESPKETEDGKGLATSTFGNSTEAYKFIYSYTYENRSYTAMQIFSVYRGNVYLFTYNASNAEYMNDKSFYSFYLNDYIQPVIENFKFVEKKGTPSKKDYPRDSDGDMLVSDKRQTGFDMYVPEEYSVDISTGIVCVSKENGVSITMSSMINSTVYPHENFLQRKAKLESLSDDGKVEVLTENNTFEPENAAMASEYEYKYTLFGVEYHVYQIYALDGRISRDFYVFTFTAPESVFADEIDEAKAIFNKIGF